MAKCTLDLSHPVFVQSTESLQGDPSFKQGLADLKKKVETEHTSCNHVVQPMPGFPDCQNKIWKYDWAPAGQRSATRKSWRMVAVVPDPAKQPYAVIAAAVYAKNRADQLTLKQLAQIFLSVIRPASRLRLALDEERFLHVRQGDQMRSICLTCGDTVALSSDITEVEEADSQHPCGGPITA